MREHHTPSRLIFSLLSIFFLLSMFFSPFPASAQTNLNLILHYVEGVPVQGEWAYDVQAYVSILDSNGNPIKDITSENFTVAEDSKQVEIGSVEFADDEPMNLVLVLDTSGTMRGAGIDAAKKAAIRFVSSLGSDDQVAMVSFNDTVSTQIDFSTDHAAVKQQIQLLDAKTNAGTCLYDAVYEAVKMMAFQPRGQRAIILLTDGKDETLEGGVCSQQTEASVIALATEEASRVPIYTLGLGRNINEAGLTLVATQTGGRYENTPDSTQLEALFMRLSDQLRSQYVIRYKSFSPPGPHQLAIKVQKGGAQAQELRSFSLPAFPVEISFTNLAEGQEVKGSQTVSVDAKSVEFIGKVRVSVGDTVAAEGANQPYSYEIDFGGYPTGELPVKVEVLGQDGKVLASRTITVKNVDAGGPTAIPTGEVEEPPKPTKTPGTDFISLVNENPLIAAVVGLVLLVLVVFILILAGRKRQDKEREEAWNRAQLGTSSALSGSEATMDGFEFVPSSNAIAVLEVTNSDDPSMIGKKFEVSKSVTTLGRNQENDIVFLKDAPVSRRHAQIELKGSRLFFKELMSVDKDGISKPPTYGTFLDDRKVGPEPIELFTDNLIRLGKRVVLQVKYLNDEVTVDNVTVDDITVDSDATLDAGPIDPDKTAESPLVHDPDKTQED